MRGLFFGRFVMTPSLLRVALVALALGAGSCNTPTEPTPQPTGPPVLACPIQQTVPSTGAGVTVTYPAPTVSGGKAPLTTPVCTPASGSTFPIGTTTVQCSVQDAEQRSASCSFGVSVTPPPRLQKTKFLAFGDSLTEGSLSLCFQQRPGMLRPTFREDAALVRSAVFNSFSYPSQLQDILRGWYSAQSPTVINEGYGGETVDETIYTGEDDVTGIQRLPGVLSLHQPEVLLLMHGINDIHQGTTPAELVSGLTVMVQEARGRGILVYLGTLLPQRIDACRNYALAEDIREANNRIKLMGFVVGAPVVDLFGAMVGKEDTLLGPDGLHPNEAGYRVMAETFFAAIKATLEAPASLGATGDPRALRSGGR